VVTSSNKIEGRFGKQYFIDVAAVGECRHPVG